MENKTIMQKLNLKQINNLITGNRLSVEIKSTTINTRLFLVVGSYVRNERGVAVRMSKILNDKNKDNAVYYFRRYEINKDYIDNNLDVSEDELINSVYINNIKNIEQLENELSKYLDNYSALDVEWKCDNPI
jgi:hypothetical protein